MGDLTWKLVPVEVPWEMEQAFMDASPLRVESSFEVRYRAMIAASPPSPTLPSRESIARAIWSLSKFEHNGDYDEAPEARLQAEVNECASAILALFTAPQPLAKQEKQDG